MTQPAAPCDHCPTAGICTYPYCPAPTEAEIAALERELLAYAATWEQRQSKGNPA
jgi:hypothetical protein